MAASGRTATPVAAAIARLDAQLYAHARTALRHAFDREHASVRDGAGWMHVAPSTVQRWLTGGLPVNPMKVLRSTRLRRHFLGCLVLLLGKGRRGAR